MNIAELFVKLGITGSNETKKELKGVATHITDIGSASLAAKAGILGIVLALKNMTQSATSSGKDLFQFATLTGIPIEQLQKYQYALAQTGGSAASLTQAVEGMQQAMSGMVNFNEGAPDGLMAIESIIDIDKTKYEDTLYMMQKLQEYSQLVLPEIARKNLLTFRGMNDEVATGMIRGTFNQKNFDAAPVLKLKEAMNLNKIGVGFSNLGKEAEVGWARFIGKFGPKALEDLRVVTKELFGFVNGLTELVNSVDGLKKLGAVFEGWGLIFKGMKEAVELIRQLKSDNPEENKTANEKIAESVEGFGDFLKGLQITMDEDDASIRKKYGGNIFEYWLKQEEEKRLKNVKPKTSNLVSPLKDEINNNLTQTVIFNGPVKEPKKTGESLKKAVGDAYHTKRTKLKEK